MLQKPSAVEKKISVTRICDIKKKNPKSNKNVTNKKVSI